MSVMPYETLTIGKTISGNPYVGRGIITGFTEDMKRAVTAYFIMGRSENSRNRVFLKEGDSVRIEPFDASKVEDPSLIIYYPLRIKGNSLIVTNGDQTDTVYNYTDDREFYESGAFEKGLETREFEPDGPNWTPRISAIVRLDKDKKPVYKQSILKSADPEGSACNRYTFSYEGIGGLGHFIHTYITDGSPIPTFTGEPERVVVPDSIEEVTEDIWNNLDSDNKISLYVRYTDLSTGEYEDRLINKNR